MAPFRNHYERSGLATRLCGVTTTRLCLAQDAGADQLLSDSPLALLIGMVLDQR